jgi:hypothetical protein
MSSVAEVRGGGGKRWRVCLPKSSTLFRVGWRQCLMKNFWCFSAPYLLKTNTTFTAPYATPYTRRRKREVSSKAQKQALGSRKVLVSKGNVRKAPKVARNRSWWVK